MARSLSEAEGQRFQVLGVTKREKTVPIKIIVKIKDTFR
jgi:hypothetical protein